MRYLVTAGKHISNTRAIARQPPTTEVDGLSEAMFSVRSAPWLYIEDARQAECSSVVRFQLGIGS
jgi:hypothetical protein